MHHRQHMVAGLEKHLPASCTVHPRKRLVNHIELEQEDADSASPIRLEFADGTTATHWS
jgi:salicylate hydroxylase